MCAGHPSAQTPPIAETAAHAACGTEHTLQAHTQTDTTNTNWGGRGFSGSLYKTGKRKCCCCRPAFFIRGTLFKEKALNFKQRDTSEWLEHIWIQAETKLVSTKNHTQHQWTESTVDAQIAASRARHITLGLSLGIKCTIKVVIHIHYVKKQKTVLYSNNGKAHTAMNSTILSLSRSLTRTIKAPSER